MFKANANGQVKVSIYFNLKIKKGDNLCYLDILNRLKDVIEENCEFLINDDNNVWDNESFAKALDFVGIETTV